MCVNAHDSVSVHLNFCAPGSGGSGWRCIEPWDFSGIRMSAWLSAGIPASEDT